MSHSDQENKPTLTTYGKYKAKAVHNRKVSSREVRKEVARHIGISDGTVLAVMSSLSEVVNRHLRHGDKVRLEQWGMMKLEITSDHVVSPEQFKSRKHIRGVRLHFLPESDKGSPELYKNIEYVKENRIE
jgi:predicted histone-like DNA-binding protein